MKTFLLVAAFAGAFLCSSSPGKPTVVRGRFVNHIPVRLMAPENVLGVELRLKVGQRVIARSFPQQDSSFLISNETNAVAKLVYGGIGISHEVYLATVLPHQPDTLQLEIELPVSKSLRHGRINCPVCRKRDQVRHLTIQLIRVIKTADKQKYSHLPYDNKWYYLDSDVGNWLDPRWYCVRDTIFF